MTRPNVHSETTGRHGRQSLFAAGDTIIIPSSTKKNKSNNSISKFHLEDRMNRFDSTYSSGQRKVGLWLRALLLVMITTAGLLSSSSVQAQTTLTTTYSTAPVCAGSSTTVTGNLTPAGVNIGYAGAGVAAAAQVAPVAANVVNLDDDQVSGQILIPGEQFVFHGETIDLGVNGFYIGSNGFITFRNAPLETQIAPRNLGAPGLNQTYNAIYLCNTDLSPQLGGQIWWEFNAATNILYVTFEDVPFFLPGGAPGVANADVVDVQLQLHCVGAANAGRIIIQVEDIQYNAAFINAAQNQVSIGLLNNCQAPAGTIGLNQANILNPGGYVNVCYSWDPAAPGLAGTQVQFFQCPTPGVDCNGVGGTNVGSDGIAPYQYVYAPPASTSNQSYFFYTRATMNNCETVTSATAQLNATATPSNPASISGNQNVCQGGSVTYTATRTVTGSTFSWSCSQGAATIVTGGTGADQATITFPAGGSQGGSSYNITVTETNPAAPSCASAAITFNNRVTIYTTPSGSITVGTPTQCANVSTTVSSSLTAPTGNTYNWSITANPTGASLSSTTVQNPTITFPVAAVVQPTAAQTTTVQVIVANGPSNLCSATFTANLVINPIPPANTVVGSPTAVCPNTNVVYTITGNTGLGNTYTYSASGLAYTWQGGYINGTSTGATSRTIQWTAAAGGTGTVTVVESTTSGCTRTYSTTTTVHALPAPSIVGANTPCQFLASATGNPSFQTAPTPLNYTYGLASGNVANGYRWVLTGGSIVAANAATTTTLPATSTNTGGTGVGGNFNTGVTQVTVQWTSTGAQSISCVENTVNGCQATTTMAVTVTASPVAADFGMTGAGIGAATIPCAGATHTYTVAGAGSHTISVSGNSSLSAATGGLSIGGGQVTGTGAGTFDVTWGSGSTGTITHEYTVGGCASLETYTISIQPLPSFTITPPSGTLCGGLSHTWNVSGLVNDGGSPTYLWAELSDPSGIGTPGATSASSFTVAFSNPGTATASYQVSCVVTGSAPTSCVSATVTSSVTITQTPSAPVLSSGAATSCASDANGTRSQSYTFTGTAGGTLNWTVSGAPAGTTTSGSVTLPSAFSVTWGQIARVASTAPTSQVVTVSATQTVAGCTSSSASTTTTLYAMPADAQVATTGGAPAITSLCAGTIVPVGLTVTTNGNSGQPTINYTWTASGVTLSAAGPATTNSITNLGGAGAKSITVTATDPASSCATTTVTSFTVAPVPTPVVSGPTAVCQEINNPVGQPHAGPWTHTYDYSTTLVSGNSYGWQATEGFIVGYSTNNGGSWITPAGNVTPVGSQTLAATVNASRIRVVFYGTTPGRVKVTETFPGGAGCGTTTPDYNVNFNPRPTAQTLSTSTANVCSGSNGTITLASSQVNWTYRLEVSTNGGTSWALSTAPQVAGTGAGLTFTVPAAELAFTATAPTASTYTFRAIATSSGASLVTGCGPYVASVANTAINVHGIPPTPTLTVNAGSERTCFGSLINFTAVNTVTWANYQLERSPAGAGVWTLVGTFGGGAGSIALADATSPAGGVPTLATPNYDFRVRAVSSTNPPACQSGNSTTASTTVFALPTNPGVTITPNPVCFEENFTVSLATTQAGVIYQVRKGGAALSPAVTVLGDGTGKTLTINSAYLMPTITSNPSTSSNVTVDVSAALVQNATHTRAIPAGGCLQSYGSTVVAVLEKPVASISSNATACGGSTTVFTPGNVTPAPNQFFDWTFTTTPPAGTTPTFANRTVNNTVNPFTVTWGDYAVSCNPVAGSPETQTHTVRLIAENANGCLDTTTRSVTLYPTPFDAFVQGDATACVYGGYEEHIKTYSLKRTLGATCTFPTGTTYAWSMSTGTVSGTIRSGQGTTDIIGEWNTTGGSGTGTVTCVVTLPASWGACSSTKSMNVTVYPLPTPAIVGPTDVCQNNPGSPTSTSNYSSTLYTGDTYKWDVVGGTITTPGGAAGAGTVASPSTVTALNQNTITVTWGSTPTNSATVTLTETTPAGCVARNTITVNVRATPTPVISGPTTMCDNAVATFSTANNAPNNTYNWAITGNGTITAGVNTASATVLAGNLAGGNFTISVTETATATTCSKTVSKVVSLAATPVPTITRVTAGGSVGGACVNQTITYGNSDATTGTFGYLWTVSANGAISGANNASTVDVNWTTTGTGTVTLSKWHSATQCTTTVAQNVTVVNPPAPIITGATNVCGNSTQTYSTTNNAGNTYSWSLGNATILSGSGTNALTVKWNNPAPGATLSSTVTVTETNTASGCSNSASVLVTINSMPTQTAIAGPATVCNGSTQNYSVTNGGGQEYSWTVTGGAIVSGNGTSAISVQWTTVGTQTVGVTITTAGTTCSTSLTRNVAVEDQPAPAITGTSPVCTGTTTSYSTPAVAGHTYQWTLSGGGTAVSGTTSNSYSVKWTTAGTHTVTVTQRNASANCQATATMNVVVNQTPTQTAISGPAVVCNGSIENYTVVNVAGQTYTWTVTGGAITDGAGTNDVAVQWTTLGNQTVSVTISTTGTNCSTSLTRNVSVEEQPNPYIAGPTVVCSGETVEYSTDDNAGHSYAWTVSGGGSIVSNPASSTINVQWTTAGSWTLSVTQVNSSGNCARTQIATVVVKQTPTATAISRVTPGGNLNQACQGQQITYSTPANAASTFNWTVTGGTVVGSATGNQVLVNWQNQGNGTITVTETTTGTTCATTRTANVAVGYQPTPAIDGARVVCIDKTHTYATLTVPGSTYNWSITPANAFQTVAGYPAASEITVRWIQPGLHTMTVTETALGGFCVGVQTINVRVNPIPTPAITSATGFGNPSTRRPGVVCNNSTHTYAVTATPDNVFQWAVTGGTILSGQNTNTITVQWGAAGAGTVACTETVPGSDCITTTTQQIDIRRTPTPVITGEVNPCGNATFDYTTPLVTGNTYTWSAIGGTGVQTAPNTFRVTCTAPVWPNTGTASVTVREDVADVAPAGTCFATTTLNVTIRPIPPVPTITGPTVVCATDLTDSPATVNTASYTSSIPTITGASGSLTPTWSVTGGAIVSGQGTLTLNVQWANGGSTPVTGTVTCLHTSTFGCTATGTLSVTVNPLPNPSIVGASSACQNTVENYSTVGVPGNTYVWSLTGGNIIRSGQGTPNVAVEWTLPGVATLTVSETNGFGCTVLNQRQVTVNALPQAQLSVSGPTTFCQGGDVTISAPLGFSNYVWNTGETARSIVVRTTGNYWCVVTDANGCSNRSDTVRVNVFPSALPIVTISGPLTFCEGGSVTLTAPAGFSGYLWSNGATTQSVTVTESGSYTVSVSDGNGCTGTSTEVDVTVYAKPTPTLTVVNGTFCTGDSATVSAPAGYVNYTWVSQNGVSYGTSRSIVVKASDDIFCQVVDVNGCAGVSDTVKLTMNRVQTPVVTVNGPTTFCEGGAVTLTAPEGYTSYVWSNGVVGRTITVDRAGEYFVTVANQTCPAVSAKTSITVNNLPAVPTIQRMGDVLSANSTAATAYQWIRNGVDMPGAANKQLTVNLPGTYRVRITDANGCENTSEGFDVILTDVNDDVVAGHQAALRVSPNPTNGRFTIETIVSEAGPVRIELVNALGELVMTLNETSVAGNFRATVDMGTLSAGAYNVVVSAGSQRWVARMVRQ